MTEFRAAHTEVFEYLADRCGVGPRTIERTAERVRAKFPRGWPAITPGRARGAAEKREVDGVHLVFLLTAVTGAPTIDAGPDACRVFVPMLSEAAFQPSVIGHGIARFPADPDPLDWTLGRLLFHLIVNQIDTHNVTFSLTVPIAQLTIRETGKDLVFRPAPRPDRKIWFPPHMTPAALDRTTAVQTLRTVPGPLIGELGGLLREAEGAPPVPVRGRDRLADLRLAA